MSNDFNRILYSIPNDENVKNIIQLGVNEAKQNDSCSVQKKDSLGQLAFDAHLYSINKGINKIPVPEKVHLAKRYIERTLLDDCNLERFAKTISWHPSYLLTKFKQFVGYTPLQYLWLLRAEKGLYLLNYTVLSVSEIAYECKFHNPEHFTNHLVRHYRCTPTELRADWEYRDVKKYLKKLDKARIYY